MVVLIDHLPSSLVHRSLFLGIAHVLLTVLLEVSCIDQVRRMRKSSSGGGKTLHNTAWYKTLSNDLVLEPITYYCTARYLCHPEATSTMNQIVAAAGIVVIEAVLYYIIHKAYHEVKGLYWIHSYHHKFNNIILPSTGMAVSVTEYVTAYLFPVVVGVTIMRADETASFVCGVLIGFANLLIHTPWMESSVKYPSWILVSAADHMSHHRRNRDNYGAPILHVDRILQFAGFQDNNSVHTLIDSSSCKGE